MSSGPSPTIAALVVSLLANRVVVDAGPAVAALEFGHRLAPMAFGATDNGIGQPPAHAYARNTTSGRRAVRVRAPAGSHGIRRNGHASSPSTRFDVEDEDGHRTLGRRDPNHWQPSLHAHLLATIMVMSM
jgi:hypothetical protein